MTRHKTSAPAIGIDLGTSKCCVGVVREGKVEIIENERGNKTTPSYVAFTDTERLVGEDAKDQVALNPTNTVFGVKRITGKGFDDRSLQKDMKFWPFKVTPDEHERPRISVRYRNGDKILSPEQISAMMLEKMKHIAESHLGCVVRDAVISVPAYFNNSQRQATKDAGTIAGLNVLGLINEPTAAALAYRDSKVRVEPHNVLIFDLGGGTFDVAVIRVDESGVKVKGVCGDAEFSGNELDVLLMQRFEDDFMNKYGKSVLQDMKGMERLRTASEKSKKTLTLLPKANVQVDSLIGDIDFSASIKRHDFEQLYYTGAEKKIEAVLKNVLEQANIQPYIIDEVVLVGGTSRIPKIQAALIKFFGGKALNKTVNPDEAVAHGAALQAAVLAGDIELEEICVSDRFQAPPLSDMKARENFRKPNYSIQDGYVKYDGESVTKVHNSKRIGKFEYFPWVDGNSKETRMPEIECLTEFEIRQLTAEVRQLAQDDRTLKEDMEALSDLQAFCFKTKALVTNHSLLQKLGQDDLSGIADRCDEVISWLDDNDSATKSEYQRKLKEFCGHILAVMQNGDVNEDFSGTEKEWFRQISKIYDEQLLREALEQLDSSELQTQQAHLPLQQGQPNSLQSTPKSPQTGESHFCQSAPPPQLKTVEPESLSLESVGDPKLKMLIENKPKIASESENIRNTLQENLVESTEESSQLASKVLMTTQLELSLKDHSKTRSQDFNSDLFSPQSNRKIHTGSLAIITQQDANIISSRSLDSGISCPSLAIVCLPTVVSLETLIGTTCTSRPHFDSGNMSPRSPSSSVDKISFESSATSLSMNASPEVPDKASGKCVERVSSEQRQLPGGRAAAAACPPDEDLNPASSSMSDHSHDTRNVPILKNANSEQDFTAVEVQYSALPCREGDLDRCGDDDLTTIGRGKADQIYNRDQKDTTTVPLWSVDDSFSIQGRIDQPANIRSANGGNAVCSQKQDIDTIIKTVIGPSTQLNKQKKSNVPSVRGRGPTESQSSLSAVQRVRVTPTAITNNPNVDLSSNTIRNLNNIYVISPPSPRMKLPNTALSSCTTSYNMVYIDRFRNYYGPTPYSAQPQTVHCNSTNASQK